MAWKRLPWFPVTLIRELGPQPAVYLGWWAEHDPIAGLAQISFDYEGKTWPVEQVLTDTANEFTFVVAGDATVPDEKMTFRPTIPADGAVARNLDISMPLPVEIIGALMNGNTSTPTLAAAVDTEGDVHTMILETGLGLYARYAGNWIRMTDISPIEQLNIVAVEPDDLTMYDEADQAGNMLSIGDLNVLDAPYKTAVEAPAGAVTAAVTVPAGPVSAILVASADDLPDAIAWAETHPESRWYVERRARAFGYEEVFPWEQ